MRLRTIWVVFMAIGLTALSAPSALARTKAATVNNGGAAYSDATPAPALTPAAGPAPAASAAPAPGPTDPANTGGQAYGMVGPVIPTVTVPGTVAKILPSGYAAAPAGAPVAVQAAIFAANQIVGRPYVYGGGHQSFVSAGYDCSGTVSFALHGANLLATPMDSSEFMRWGVRGPGLWITLYSNPGHVYMTIAGIRLDTSTAGDPSRLSGPRWRPLLRSSRGFRVRSLAGL
ncbi:MAG: hypothetical protein ACR2KV_11675 [Solirubrobacteraceae bacterium]